MNNIKKFEDLEIGDEYVLRKNISKIDVENFINMTGDNNPLHVDKNYAENTPFKDIVVHGMLGASFVSTIIGTRLPGPGSLWLSQNFNFLLPVRLGDELKISCKVQKINIKERVLVLDTTIHNQHKKLVLNGTGVVKVLKEVIKKEVESIQYNRVALVTGGAGGIGSAICKKLVEQDFRVIFTYNNSSEKATKLVNELNQERKNVVAIKLNLTEESDLEKLYLTAINEFGAISVLINNASPKINPVSILNLEWSEIDCQLITQVKSALFLSRLCIPGMIDNKWGRIINITSQVVEDEPTIGWAAYSLAKAGMHQLSRHMAKEFGLKGITVNCVAPGMCDTNLIGEIPEKIQMIVERQTPLRRLALPEDIANAVGFLISDSASFITGQTLSVNGGIKMS